MDVCGRVLPPRDLCGLTFSDTGSVPGESGGRGGAQNDAMHHGGPPAPEKLASFIIPVAQGQRVGERGHYGS